MTGCISGSRHRDCLIVDSAAARGAVKSGSRRRAQARKLLTADRAEAIWRITHNRTPSRPYSLSDRVLSFTVDATIIAAPSSTKNAAATRDPEMKQTRKGRTWYFGMKLHIGADKL